MSLFDRTIEAIKESEGKTKAYMFMRMAQVAHPEGDPDRLFFEWLHQWEGNIKEGITSLGLDVPPNGKRLIERIRELVTPVLVDRWQADAAAKERQYGTEH